MTRKRATSGDGVGEVELERLLEALALLLGEHRVHDPLDHVRRQLGQVLHPLQVAVEPDHRVVADREVQVGAAALDDLGEHEVEVEVARRDALLGRRALVGAALRSRCSASWAGGAAWAGAGAARCGEVSGAGAGSGPGRPAAGVGCARRVAGGAPAEAPGAATGAPAGGAAGGGAAAGAAAYGEATPGAGWTGCAAGVVPSGGRPGVCSRGGSKAYFSGTYGSMPGRSCCRLLAAGGHGSSS